jgi:hypothetical protein
MAKMPDHNLPDGITDQNGAEIRFLDVHRAFAETPMGQALASNARYDRYRPDSIPPEEWERLLGRDVNNLRHMPLTYELAEAFLKGTPDARLSASEIQTLLLTAIVHDWAEADPDLGDITYDLKLDSDEKKESQILALMLRNRLGEILSPETLGSIHKTVFDRTGKLGETFNAIERLGYLRTALNAWRSTDNPFHSAELTDSLEWLCSNVLGNQIEALLGYAMKYPPVAQFLSDSERTISQAFEKIPETVFSRYPDSGAKSERQVQHDKFLRAKTLWEQRKI